MSDELKPNDQQQYVLERLRNMPIKDDGDLIFQSQCIHGVWEAIKNQATQVTEPRALTLEELKSHCMDLDNKPLYVVMNGDYLKTCETPWLVEENSGWQTVFRLRKWFKFESKINFFMNTREAYTHKPKENTK